eukprot:TRINITY_DN4083_c0_g1_i1.p1 TRINITY_DN4083_c0_g1~~TRINITY_DN4083_c0_g1_i1.p1  ORF type:complete len:374 (-),score=99.89 TRINITY_DN4083_c0_g1_i1:38-1159(-)
MVKRYIVISILLVVTMVSTEEILIKEDFHGGNSDIPHSQHLPVTMKAVLMKDFGGPQVLYVGETEKPTCGEGQLLIKVVAFALNRADTLQRKGRYPSPPGESDILGLEASGIVEEVGANVEGWKVGDRIMSLLGGGGYAEYVVIPAGMGMQVPENFSLLEAAGVPEAFLTAFQAIFWIGKLEDNETVLFHAGASGVGTSAIQLTKIKDNVKVFITAGSEEKIKFCTDLGAIAGVNYKKGPWIDEILELTDGGVDFILDFVGKDYFQQNIDTLNLEGRMVVLAFLSGVEVEQFNMAPILRKRLSIHGSTLRSRSLQYKIDLSQDFIAQVGPSLNDGSIKPVISKVLPMESIVEAHQFMEENMNIGKIIIQVSEE